MKNKIITITGGTGSFGNAIVKKLLMTDSGVKEIRVFSRDEKKQDDMRRVYADGRIKFYLGDVRDSESLDNCIKGSDYLFHAAALKQVPSCEFFPLEAFKTNVMGTENVLNTSIKYQLKKVICLSTDKAVYPINAMGISKAMMEKVALAKSRTSNATQICITRYGNVMGSRGSVIPLFMDQAKNNNDITITNPNMTRFLMSLDEAVNLVLYAFNHIVGGSIYVQKSPACTIGDLAEAIRQIFEISKDRVINIGTRHGEKDHEVLVSREELNCSDNLQDYFRVRPDIRDLNYGIYTDKGVVDHIHKDAYSSSNTEQLSIEQIKMILRSQFSVECP
jgi:UDP-glucose 4-epimerase